MKVTLSLALLLTFGTVSEAGPLDWVKHHKRFLLMESAAVTGAAIHYAGLRHCRRANGVEPCDAHYGGAWAAFGFTTGITVIAMPAIAESCWKDGQGKFCNIFAYSGSAGQASWGIHEWRIREKKP